MKLLSRDLLRIIFLFVLICLIEVTGCSTNHTSQEDLQKRINELWTAKVQKKWDVVYDMSEKSYRESTSKEKDIAKRHLDILEYSFIKSEIDDSGKTAKSYVKMKIKGLAGLIFEPTVSDVWIVEDGKWYVRRLPTNNLFKMN